MRDQREDQKEDQKVVNIPMNERGDLRRAAFKYYYNNYEYCTFQQRTSKQIAHQTKTIITK